MKRDHIIQTRRITSILVNTILSVSNIIRILTTPRSTTINTIRTRTHIPIIDSDSKKPLSSKISIILVILLEDRSTLVYLIWRRQAKILLTSTTTTPPIIREQLSHVIPIMKIHIICTGCSTGRFHQCVDVLTGKT